MVPTLRLDTRRRSTSPNLYTVFCGLELEWRVDDFDGGAEIELLSRVNLTDMEYARAEENAIDEWMEY